MKRNIPFIILICSILLIGSCKKKKDDEDSMDDGNNGTTGKSLPGTCSMVSHYSSTVAPSVSYTYNYNYTYNSDGLVSSYSYQLDGGSTTTKNYTYTKNGNGQVIKKDEGGGTYREIQYTNGKVTQYKDYTSNVLGYTYNYVYESNKITLNTYNSSGQLFSKTVFTLSGDNTVSQDYTLYHTGTTNVSTESHYTYSGYDDKYSISYVLSLHDPAIITSFKNNFTGYTFTSTSYNTSGAVTLTMNSTSTDTYTYNSNGTVASNNNTISTSVNGAAATTTTTSQTYSYSGCD